MKVEYSNRGFEYIKHPIDPERKDLRILVQQSSGIGGYDDAFDRPGSSRLWIGHGDFRHEIDREEVDDLIKHLTAWKLTGSLELTDD